MTRDNKRIRDNQQERLYIEKMFKNIPKKHGYYRFRGWGGFIQRFFSPSKGLLDWMEKNARFEYFIT